VVIVKGECPTAETLDPCSCTENSNGRNIQCYGSTEFDLNGLFKKISKELEGKDKTFKDFSMRFNPYTIELPENVFEDIQFERIAWLNCALERVDKKAFDNIKDSITGIYFYGTPLTNSNFFDAIDGMTNLKELLLQDTHMTQVPDQAFVKQSHLSTIILNNNMFETIGDHIFGDASNLKLIQFQNNSINSIADTAFDCTVQPTVPSLVVGFEYNQLNGDSMPKYIFPDSKADITVDFTGNHVSVLNEDIFHTFLKSNDNNVIINDGMDCSNCKNYWLIKDDTLKREMSSLKCIDGLSFDDSSHFAGC